MFSHDRAWFLALSFFGFLCIPFLHTFLILFKISFFLCFSLLSSFSKNFFVNAPFGLFFFFFQPTPFNLMYMLHTSASCPRGNR